MARKKHEAQQEPTIPVHPTEMVPLTDVRPHPRNYRGHPAEQLAHLTQSLVMHGVYRNVVIAQDGTLLAGHGVVEAAAAQGLTHVPAVRLPVGPDEPEAIQVLVGDNEIARSSLMQDRLLVELLTDLQAQDSSLLLGTGFNEDLLRQLAETVGLIPPDMVPTAEADRGMPVAEEALSQSLVDRFGVPPFSVFDARQGYWQDRKRAWLALGIQSELGRGDVMPSGASSVNAGSSQWAGKRGGGESRREPQASNEAS